jgi:hypothetical protein
MCFGGSAFVVAEGPSGTR